MATVAEIQELYDRGKIPEAMAAVWAEVFEERVLSDPEIPELCAIRAWCHYRRREWEDVHEWIARAGDTLRAKRLRAYMSAYVDKNDATLRQIAQEIGDDVGVQNALVIRARDADSEAVSLDELESILARFADQTEVDVANLFHNAARLYLAKARGEEDLGRATICIEAAFERYGKDRNWHHRAAATHWLSVAFERLGRKEQDKAARMQARQLWERAVELDPTNQGFQTNLKNALAREAALASIQGNWQ